MLKETINVLKKDPGADMTNLSNRIKTMVVSTLKDKYAPPLLFRELDLARRSYYYQISAMSQADKLVNLRIRILEIFHEGQKLLWILKDLAKAAEAGNCRSLFYKEKNLDWFRKQRNEKNLRSFLKSGIRQWQI